jgi:PAS domain S-box-containing protein
LDRTRRPSGLLRWIADRWDLFIPPVVAVVLFVVVRSTGLLVRSEDALRGSAYFDEVLTSLVLVLGTSSVVAIRRWSLAQREHDLRASAEARYRVLVERVPVVAYIWDGADQPGAAPAGYLSPQLETLLGYPPERWVEDPAEWTRAVHPDDLSMILHAWTEAVSSRGSFRAEYRLRSADGRWIWVRDEAVPVSEGSSGAPIYQGVMSDVTERHEAEVAVREAEERFRGLVEQVPVAVYTDAVDETSTARYVSPRYEEVTGYSREERLSDPGLWLRMLHPEDRDQVQEESLRTNGMGEPFDMEYRIFRKDGTVAWLHDHAVLETGSDGTPAWQGVLWDVTEQHLAEEALARRDAILQATAYAAERFLGSASWFEALGEILEQLARAGGAQRAVLFTNERGDDGELRCVRLGSWLAPGFEALEDAGSVSFAWDDGFRRWADVLGSGLPLHGSVTTLPPEERRHFEDKDLPTEAVLAVPVMVEGEWWGYLGFDHCLDERLWDDADLEALQMTANTLGAALLRERDAARLIEAEVRHRTLIEQIPAVTYVQQSDGEITYCSPQVREMLGYAPDEWSSTTWSEILHPDDVERVEAEDERTNRTGDPFRMEYRAIAKDGRLVWIRDEAHLLRGPEGQIRYWQGVQFDVTAEKEAEQALREAEERYRGIVEHIPAAIYLDEAGRSMAPVYVSPQIEAITGIPAEEWLADPEAWLHRMAPEDRDRVMGGYLRAAEDGTAWCDEYRLQRPDGRMIWVRDETTFLHDDEGNHVLLQGVLFDITERKLAEEALRESERREREAAERLRALDEMKNTFLAAVSHELRTPLTTILGLSLTLERNGMLGGQDRIDLLARLTANARKLDRLLRDLLDIDRLQRGVIQPQRRMTDVGALGRRTVEHLDALAGREISVLAEPVEIAVDPAKVERIIENLLMNALRHTGADRRIWLRIGPSDGGAAIVVEDDGQGVPIDLQEAVFEPFRQGSSDGPHQHGTGIGLSLVARFTELHGGRAWVTDRVGGGASFHVFLPRGPVEEADDPRGLFASWTPSA